MSFLTKLLALLMSLLSIFLCGAVVIFVTNMNDWKKRCQEQETLTQAAQIYALVLERELKDQKQTDTTRWQTFDKIIVGWKNAYSKLENNLKQKSISQITAESRADSSVEVSKALTSQVDSMRQTIETLQKRLESAHADKRIADTQVAELNQELNQAQVKVGRLESIRYRNEEKIRSQESEIALLEQKFQQVMLGSSDARVLLDNVTVGTPQTGRVPIRGEITNVLGDRAAISVGSSSGVRENMEFNIFRGSEFLGSFVALEVAATESAGRLHRKQGTIVKGDKISTGFD